MRHVALVLVCLVLLHASTTAANDKVGVVFSWNETLHRCVYTQSSVLSVCGGVASYTNSSSSADVPCDTNRIRWTNHCKLRWIGNGALSENGTDPSIFDSIPEIHLVGDSTVLRLFMHATNASHEDYFTKVAKLEIDEIQANLTLPHGRLVPLYFHRSLHVALAPVIVSRVLSTAKPKALVLIAYGPHDTSWLVFRRAMPFFRNVNVGKFIEASKYWKRWTMSLVKAIADALLVRPVDERPIVVAREHFIANCRHPKYSKYPLITRCNDLLNPTVIPFYRRTLNGLLMAFGIPTVSIDGAFPPCVLIDAGHVNRPCKTIEWQLIVQAYHLMKRTRHVQGGASDGAVKAALWQLIGSDALAAEVMSNASVAPTVDDERWINAVATQPVAIVANEAHVTRSSAPQVGSYATTVHRLTRFDRGERLLLGFGVPVLAAALYYTFASSSR